MRGRKGGVRVCDPLPRRGGTRTGGARVRTRRHGGRAPPSTVRASAHPLCLDRACLSSTARPLRRTPIVHVEARHGERAMTKSEIVAAVYGKVGGFSKKEAADVVELVFETVKETLGRGEKIKISGFGNFVLRDKRQRRGRNPQTGEPLTITERRVLSFKPSQILKSILNPEDPEERAALAAAAQRETGRKT